MVRTASYLCVVFGAIIQGVFGSASWIRYSPAICALEGSSVNMSCFYTNSLSEISQNVSWLYATKWSDITSDPLYKDRVYVDYDGHKYNLRIKNLTKSDAKINYCRIAMSNEKFQPAEQGVKLSVTGLRVKIDIFPDNILILACDTTCELDGNLSFIWMRNGIENSRSDSKFLQLKNFSRNYEGNYTCAVSKHAHISSPVVNLYLPRNTNILIDTAGVTEEGNVSLTCISDSNPPVKSYTWFKVNQSTPVGSGQQFNITRVRSQHGGLYYCEAKSDYGADNSSTVSVTVADRQSVISVSVTTGVAAGGMVGLLCILCYIRHFKRSAWKRQMRHEKTTAQSDVQCSTIDFQRSGKSRPVGVPSKEAAGGAEGDVLCFRETAGVHGDDVQYASVQFKKAEITHNSADKQQGELSIIYSSVQCRADHKLCY